MLGGLPNKLLVLGGPQIVGFYLVAPGLMVAIVFLLGGCMHYWATFLHLWSMPGWGWAGDGPKKCIIMGSKLANFGEGVHFGEAVGFGRELILGRESNFGRKLIFRRE